MVGDNQEGGAVQANQFQPLAYYGAYDGKHLLVLGAVIMLRTLHIFKVVCRWVLIIPLFL